MESLIRAAQNGKEVTVVVELMARFDEEANIGWATKLEQVGAQNLLQLADLRADRGRRQAQLIGGAGEMQVPGRSLEGA